MRPARIAASALLAALVLGSAPSAAAAGEGAISGRVVDARTGQAIGEVCVTAAHPGLDAEGYEALVDAASVRSSADGRYRIAGLPPRTDYRIVFRDCSARFYSYVPETWDGRPGRRLDGSPITVAPAGEASNIDASLDQVAVLRPTVVDPGGAPVRDAIVRVEPVGHELPPELPDTRTTSADGRPQPMGLAPGWYRVEVVDQRAGLLPGWLDERDWREDADLVLLASGTTSEPRVRLGRSSLITGRVEDARVAPISGGQVYAVRVDDPERDVASTGVQGGTFTFQALPAGSYKLRAVGESTYGEQADGTVVGGPSHLPTWFGGTSFETATTFTVGPDRPASGLVVRLPDAGAITGRVTGPDGVGLAAVCVGAFAADGRAVGHGTTFDDGRYLLWRLPTGSYRVRYEDCSSAPHQRAQPLVHRWSGDAARFTEATPVQVQAGATTTSVDARLGIAGGSIAGRVQGLQRGEVVCLQARSADDPTEPPLTPRPGGASYVVRGLVGRWFVGAAECRSSHSTSDDDADDPVNDPATAWYGGSTAATATPVTVAVGSDRSGIDIVSADRVRRLAGTTRIETAAAISAATFRTSSRAVLARADEFADGLAGGPLAGHLEAPLLLTTGDRLSPAAATELRRLGATSVVLLGGTAALGPGVESDLQALGATPDRVAGSNRFETARAVAERVGGTEAYVVEGRNPDPARGWPDAVAVSARAAASSTPILLVERDHLPDATRAALAGRSSATVVGGTAAVSRGVEDAVRAIVGTVGRVAGVDRYDTSARFAGPVAGVDDLRPWVATGLGWPDALAAGPAAAHVGAPLLLVHGRAPTAATIGWLDARAGRLHDVTVVGDQGAVAPASDAAFRRRLAVEPPWPTFPDG